MMASQKSKRSQQGPGGFYESVFESALYRRVLQGEPELPALVKSASEKAAQLLSTVVRDMPLYTFHNERHILNIISWMERLLGGNKGIDFLSPLECAIAILAAYTHDLGMTLSESEREELQEDPNYLHFIDRFQVERDRIRALRQSGEHRRANLIENHLRTGFLRDTHCSDEFDGRLRTRIQQVAPDLHYRNFSFRRQLELVAISHNQRAKWLRLQFEKENLAWRETVGQNEAVNFVFIGILLRLADIMDFDATRTPSILFRHIGLERELSASFEKTSSDEWQKHLAITGFKWPLGGPVLTYRAANCPHPAVEKSIREFTAMINREIENATSELRHAAETEGYQICLPHVAFEIRPALDRKGLPCYSYHDWSFRLDQDEIVRLLMGESLYGDPSLCIRELLQNALDAIELRDLRHQLKKRGGQPAHPVDGEQLPSGVIAQNGVEQHLEVTLTWGEDGNRPFIRVTDNGTGMTEEIIEEYFTEIGKSFYRSADFRREQAEMRHNGLIATPISTFGIGVISCFMIADSVSVRTHPGGVSESRRALDLEISGPGSLFWTRPGTREIQGTEITLWLRKELKGKPVRLEHDQRRCFEKLRTFFKYGTNQSGSDADDGLDPGFIAAQHVVWPKYSVQIRPPAGDCWTIDEHFHRDYLAPIDEVAFNQKLQEFDHLPGASSRPSWTLHDWTDNKGEEATGTRVRLWVPNVDSKDALPFWELATLIEPQVKQMVPLVTVQSMRVLNTDIILPKLPLAPGLGSRVWIDLRGKAAPQLTADRGKALVPLPSPNEATDWTTRLIGVWNRYARALARSVDRSDEETRELRQKALANKWSLTYAEPLRSLLDAPPSFPRLVGDSSGGQKWRLATSALLMDINLDLVIGQDLARDSILDDALDRAVKRATALTEGNRDDRDDSRDDSRDDILSDADRALPLALILARALSRARDLQHDPALALTLTLALLLSVSPDLNFSGNLAEDLVFAVSGHNMNWDLLRTSWLQEGFFPDLGRSWPPLGLQYLQGKIGDAVLTAPAEFSFDRDQRRVLFADQHGQAPPELHPYGYDLCFPTTAIPLGKLRESFPAWRDDRRYRSLGVVPFLFPGLGELWDRYKEGFGRLFPIDAVYALQPAQNTWFKPFADWTQEDWDNPVHRSIFWDIQKGRVIDVPGIHTRAEARKLGQPS